MIYIDLTGYSPDHTWSVNAARLKTELIAKPTLSEKKAFIEENKKFWGIIKSSFPHADKCWYSEAKESVSPYEIEHFRPSKATRRSTGVKKFYKAYCEAQRKDWVTSSKYAGAGYWWLAFDYTNYRNSGKLINSIKSTRFPLRLGSSIAYEETDDCSLEVPLLLDPTVSSDPDLLTFDPYGKAAPTIVDPMEHDHFRAVASIHIYGLNAIDTLVKHRLTKWAECTKAIERASERYKDVEQAINDGDTAALSKNLDQFMDFVQRDIRPAMEPSSEFSAVARACVMSFVALDWINDYVLK